MKFNQQEKVLMVDSMFSQLRWAMGCLQHESSSYDTGTIVIRVKDEVAEDFLNYMNTIPPLLRAIQEKSHPTTTLC